VLALLIDAGETSRKSARCISTGAGSNYEAADLARSRPAFELPFALTRPSMKTGREAPGRSKWFHDVEAPRLAERLRHGNAEADEARADRQMASALAYIAARMAPHLRH
jgi:hypothetical protein